MTAAPPGIRLGLRENRVQFALLVLVNAFVGAMAGAERSVPRSWPKRSSGSPPPRRPSPSWSPSA